MSAKTTNKYNQGNSRTIFYTSKKNQTKKKKAFNYPKNKIYSEEAESSPSKKEKEYINEDTNSDFPKNNLDTEIIYEDEYQGLIYHQGYLNVPPANIYYYIEKDPKDEYNNFKTKWKTEICHYWEMYGECKFGDNCAFAHGDAELKQRKLTYNYKTKPCKQFFENGYCSYGSRCQFSHKKEDLKEQKNDVDNLNDKVSYLKIIEELNSEEKKISHELIKRPRLLTFESITHSTLEESKNSKLKLYEDFINIKKEKSKKEKNISFKLSDDTNSNSNISSDINANEKEYL
jgi:hypothetical protein